MLGKMWIQSNPVRVVLYTDKVDRDSSFSQQCCRVEKGLV